MDYEFLVRTADNVEIILDVSIFWQITDLYKLVLVTQDPPEDICKFYQLFSRCLL
jgi:regulator of protease activity HflC (stomatin/prohibitin superfamily)